MTRSNSWRDHLQQAAREGAERFFSDIPPDQIAEDDLGEVLSNAVHEAADQHDSGLGWPARLDVRVHGRNVVGSGRLNSRVAHDLLGPIQGEVISSLPQGISEKVGQLDLVGIGSGSTVLHFELSNETQTKGEDYPLSAFNSALQSVFDLHDEVEAQPSIEDRCRSNDLIENFHRLVSVLDKYDLELDMVWRVPGMRRRRSRLSAAGRRNANLLFETTQVLERKIVSGYVHGQSLNGQLVLKANPAKKNSATHVVRIPSSTLSELQLHMSDYIRIQAMAEYRRDGFNRNLSRNLIFERIMPHENDADETNDEET